MPTHVAILLPQYIRLVLNGVKTIESRLTLMPLAPFRSVTPGDRIYFKASGGPFMATAIADAVEYHSDLTPARVDALKRKYNASVCGDDAYWTKKRGSRYATFITLRDVQPIGNADAPKIAPSRGLAWFTLPAPKPSPGASPGANPGASSRVPGVRAPASKKRMKPRAIAAPNLVHFITAEKIARLIGEARSEDLGPGVDDITSRLLVPATQKTVAMLRARATGALSGGALLLGIAKAYDPKVKVEVLIPDGSALSPGDVVARFSGSLRSILAIERVALNFCTHLSGIASVTRCFVHEVAGTKARIYDTRKTHAGLRELEKYAVVCGGGFAHRMGLYDAVLVKDNHIAHIPLAQLAGTLGRMMIQAKISDPKPRFIMIEVDTLNQLEKVLAVSPDIVLLDNMDVSTIRRAVALRDRIAPSVELEVSGGVRLTTVRAFAQTGIDRISIGALTHSAPALDLGLDID